MFTFVSPDLYILGQNISTLCFQFSSLYSVALVLPLPWRVLWKGALSGERKKPFWSQLCHRNDRGGVIIIELLLFARNNLLWCINIRIHCIGFRTWIWGRHCRCWCTSPERRWPCCVGGWRRGFRRRPGIKLVSNLHNRYCRRNFVFFSHLHYHGGWRRHAFLRLSGNGTHYHGRTKDCQSACKTFVHAIPRIIYYRAPCLQWHPW